MDNVYVLNYIINKELMRKGGRVIAFFVDFKAAFDSVDRKVLWKSLEKKRVDGELIERLKEVYEKTACKVRVGKEMGEVFWTAKGVRQGCPLSANLFTLLLADLDERMEGRRK